jgi:diguanylate cyclase (GGDEF)-like protein
MRTQRAHRYQELLEQAAARLVTMAETDSLTGLLNRSKFEEVLSARVKDQDQLSILMIGLNGFLGKNISVSQPVSDEALKTLARLLKAQARPQDYCARIGVDEFCLLMPGAGREQAAGLRERIRSVLAKTVIAPQTLNLGMQVSVGIASLPADALSAEDLLIRADRSMVAQRRDRSIPDMAPDLVPDLLKARSTRHRAI